jgi:hypothetical protein
MIFLREDHHTNTTLILYTSHPDNPVDATSPATTPRDTVEDLVRVHSLHVHGQGVELAKPVGYKTLAAAS